MTSFLLLTGSFCQANLGREERLSSTQGLIAPERSSLLHHPEGCHLLRLLFIIQDNSLFLARCIQLLLFVSLLLAHPHIGWDAEQEQEKA